LFARYLALHDFRSWPTATVELQPGRTVLVGPNGYGKTNIVEALVYLSTLSSHRVASDQPLIRRGAEAARISAIAVNAGRELRVDLDIQAGKANRARINNSPVPRPRELLGIVKTVMFAPEDLSLVRGDPDERRRFADNLLAARSARLAGVRADYDKVLRQRSALLKTLSAGRRSGSVSAAQDTLEVWDGYVADLGAQLLLGRLTVLNELAPHLIESYQRIAPHSRPASLRYRSSVGEAWPEPWRAISGALELPSHEELAELLAAQLKAHQRREIERGLCLVGPHRDDVDLMLGEEPAKGYASHGESWSYALALKLASFALLRAEGTDPILILDDVFAELDRSRRLALTEVAKDAEQVIITAAVPEDVPAELEGVRYAVEMDNEASTLARCEEVKPHAT
jgi:DNA replication and repair protein RecF